jgi:hypothetical protein
MDRDRRTTWAIGGATFGIAAACAVVLLRTLDQSATLGFLGGAVGARLAVLGAVWLEDRRGRIEKQARRSLLADALCRYGSAAVRLQHAPDSVVSNALHHMRQATEAFGIVRGIASFDHAGAALEIATLDYWGRKYDGRFERAAAALDNGGITAAAARAAIDGEAAHLAKIVRLIFGEHAYWGESGRRALATLERQKDYYAGVDPAAPHVPKSLAAI